MSAELLRTLEQVVSGAIRVRGAYKKRGEGTLRVFGGVNIVMCADFWQLHPVNGTFLASSPMDVPAGCALRALELFWQSDPDSIRSFWNLTELMRCEDQWFNSVLGQCRVGSLSMSDYNFLHGLPTLVSPCPNNCSCNDDVICDPVLGPYRSKWKEQFMAGCPDMGSLIRTLQSECASCSAERSRRHRVLSTAESLKPELRTHPSAVHPLCTRSTYPGTSRQT